MALPKSDVTVSPRALEGVRIVDFTWVRAGPWATRWLGALGAEVIKVEWPLNDRGRLTGTVSNPPGMERTYNTSGFFNDTNANKLGVTMNVRSPKGTELIKRLISLSDVVIENFSSRVLQNWGLGYEELCKLNPQIVYVSMSGFGHTGRHHHYATFGPIAQALSGMTFLSGLPGQPPAGWGWSYLDDTGGMYGAMSVLTGLYHRNLTGRGQHIDLAQMITGITLNGPALLDRTVNGRPSHREGYPSGNRAHWPGTPPLNNYRGPTVAPHNAYRTRGGGYNDWCAIVCFSDQEWMRLVELMGSPGWATAPTLATMRGRLDHQEDLDRGIEQWSLGLEKYELAERCQSAGVRAMPVQSSEDRAEHDPQLRHREMYKALEHPALGSYRLQNAPFKLSETPAINRTTSPLIGQHNQEVLEGLLGLSHEELVEGYKDATFWPESLEMFPYTKEMLEGGPLQDSSGWAVSSRPRKAAGDDAGPGESTHGPLVGLRVLELADERGQFCGKLMADLGADVIKIEPPGGQNTRSVGPFLDDIPHRDRSLSFWHYNTSKRGITLDLNKEDGRALFRRLASTADVILESLAPGYLPSHGLGYEELKGSNPGLVMCSLSDFGQTGPWRDYLASDLLHLAAGGQMASCGYSEEDVPDPPPIAPGGGNAWHMGGHYAYMAIMAALVYRTSTGRGQYIDASVHDACTLTTEGAMPVYLYRGKVVIRQTGRHHSETPTPPAQLLSKDGKWVIARMAAELNPRTVRRVAEWMDTYGMAEDLLDERYRDPEVIREDASHIVDLVNRNLVGGLTQEELYHGAQERGIQWGAIRTPEDLVDDGHLEDRGFWTEVLHPELGRSFKYPGPAAIYNGSPWRISRRAPLVGEHNEEVYCKELGLQRADLALLSESGVV